MDVGKELEPKIGSDIGMLNEGEGIGGTGLGSRVVWTRAGCGAEEGNVIVAVNQGCKEGESRLIGESPRRRGFSEKFNLRWNVWTNSSISTAKDTIGTVAGFRLQIGGGNSNLPLSFGNGSGYPESFVAGNA